MKENKILRTICYILLPFLIGIILISFISSGIKNSEYYNEKEYFKSNVFLGNYMTTLLNAARNLIYKNKNYDYIQDGENTIYFYENSNKIADEYYLIKYKNKVITNVELTTETNTIETIKEYIQNNPNSKKVKIINGKIESDSDIINKKGLQYFNEFDITYYSRQNGEKISTKIEDYEIYSSFVEKITDQKNLMATEIVNKIDKHKNTIYIAVPFCALLTILIVLYLIISIGHEKGTEGITVNDFDSIPIETIIFVEFCVGVCVAIPFIKGFNIMDSYNELLSIIIMIYFVWYVLIAIIAHTVIKRIKSRTFIETTLIGNIICKLIEKIKKICNTISYSPKLASRIFSSTIMIVLIGIFILKILDNFAIFLFYAFYILFFVIYKINKLKKQYAKIENKLKEMYEGNNQTVLESSKFDGIYQNAIKYLNDISHGLENAVEERIKSEKLKAELITNVSHDLKTPLTSIINYVDLLKNENIQNEKAEEYVKILDNKSQRLKKLTEDLIEASKISTGNISLNMKKINIVELIKQSIGEFEDKFQKQELEVNLNNNENEIFIMADSRYLFRVVENLFSNISKYALPKSRVYIDIKTEGSKVKIELKNISKDKLNISGEELMQRFVRGDKARTTEGSGLGLSIAQNLTEMQKGEFKLQLDGDLFKVILIFEII